MAVTLGHQQQEQAVEGRVMEGKGGLYTLKIQEREVELNMCLGGRVTKARFQDAGKTQRTEAEGRESNEKELTLDNQTAERTSV